MYRHSHQLRNIFSGGFFNIIPAGYFFFGYFAFFRERRGSFYIPSVKYVKNFVDQLINLFSFSLLSSPRPDGDRLQI